MPPLAPTASLLAHRTSAANPASLSGHDYAIVAVIAVIAIFALAVSGVFAR